MARIFVALAGLVLATVPAPSVAAQLSDGSLCAGSADCASGYCVDGVCCSSPCVGACSACDLAGAVGTCRATSVGTSGVPACSPYVCDGMAASCPSRCSSDAGCAVGFGCVDDVCAARQSNGTVCTTASACLSGSCADGYCCDAACGQSCDACSTARGATANGVCTIVPASNPGHPLCFPYRCPGSSAICTTSCTSNAQCASGAFCDTALGRCIGDLPNGSGCSTETQCASGYCVDGFCCHSACVGGCDVCSVAAGSSGDGVCTILPAASAGDAICGAYVCDGTATCPTSCASDDQCAASHHCVGGACVPKLPPGHACGATRECLSGHCVDGFCCDAACDAECDSCTAATSTSGLDGSCAASYGGVECGGGYVCSGTSLPCPASCAESDECAFGYVCDAGACVVGQPTGAACTDPGACASGHCADGRCCDRPCTGQCEACDLATMPGTCGNVVGEPHGGRPSCGGLGVCGGACDGVGADACTVGASPTSETCDGRDEDCDGVVDNGATCGAGESCVDGTCIVATNDGGVADGGSSTDGGVDAGDRNDASGSFDATTGPRDASAGIDGGPSPGAGSSGCGCRVARSPGGRDARLVWFALALIVARRRRPRAAGPTARSPRSAKHL